MIYRKAKPAPRSVYPVDPWRMVEKRFYPRLLGQTETHFALCNGYLGLRGNHDEGRPQHEGGTFINGFYESWPIVHGESAFGFAKTGQTMVDVTDAKVVRLYVDDEPLHLPTAELEGYERALDMRAGTLDRRLVWETPSGKRVAVRSRRLVSLEHRHVAAVEFEVELLNADAPVVLNSRIAYQHRAPESTIQDPRKRALEERALLPEGQRAREARVVLSHRTRKSGMTLACGIDHVLETECEFDRTMECNEDEGRVSYAVKALCGRPIRLVKHISYHSSRSAPASELRDRADRSLDRSIEEGFEALLGSQRRRLDAFWDRADVQVGHDPALQQAVRFNLFQLYQNAARVEGAGLPAKGLTGHGYEGHYFWDTEIYVIPFLIYTMPRVARTLIRFRCSLLDAARQRAREVNQQGALFPWRTINGEEASAYYAAGTAQYHINADVAYAIRKYVQMTGDEELLVEVGAEVLVETARLWLDIGFFSERKDGSFCIHGVTGPDEYTAVVNNNTFTNLMAREHLWYAAEAVEMLRDRHPEAYQELRVSTELDPGEPARWKQAADRMYVAFDDKLGIHPQDDQFLERKRWDFENTPPDHYPLLLHYHPLVIYRQQVIKQADVVLALFLLGDEFSREEKKRNFDYYDPLTTGDSSLSVCIQSILAFELGYSEKAREYIRYSLLMDLEDVHGNVDDGLHIASIGGTWMAVTYGFAGMRDYDGQLSFRPRRLQQAGGSLRFSLTVRGRLLEVRLDDGHATYVLREGADLELTHLDEKIRLDRENPTAMRPSLPWSRA